MWFSLQHPSLRVTPVDTLDLGSVVQGAAGVSHDVTLSNTGAEKVTISRVAIVQDDNGPFHTDVHVPFDVEPGQNPTITVTFAPQSAATFDAALTIEAETNRDSFEVKLHGVGQAPP
jgi:hypothetical protein